MFINLLISKTSMLSPDFFRTLATQTGMTNKWLKDQGSLSVKDLWVNIHYPAYGPVIFVNRPVRTRTPGGVGAGGEKPPATRL